MKFVKVPVAAGGPLHFLCTGCGRVVDQRAVTVYADLDGVAFNSYYCATCAERHNPRSVTCRAHDGVGQ